MSISVGRANQDEATPFLQEIVRLRLVAPETLEQTIAQLPPARRTDLSAILDALIQAGELTRFQADKLRRGHGAGLTLGHYGLLCPIGRGGMGIVYLARRLGTTADQGELFALKVLPPLRAKSEPRTLTRFLREMQLGLRLPDHPGLTRTIDHGVSNGVHYLAMDYVPGQTVRQIVGETGPMAIARAARVFADVAGGLHAAHEIGFVHRDLKPSNIMILPTGRAKLLDFGFGLFLDEEHPEDPAILGGQGYTMGTMDYLAPEQAVNAAQVTRSSDLYSLGCSLYYAVTGCVPFPGGTAQDKIRWHRTDVPPSVTQFNPLIPIEFARLIEWLMAKKTHDRPASGELIQQQLLAWAEPVAAVAVDPRQVSPGSELLRNVEEHWRESAQLTQEDESLVLEPKDEEQPLANESDLPPGWILPLPIVLAGVGFCVALVMLACVVGILFGWLLRRGSL